MNKKRILLIFKILSVVTIVICGALSTYVWLNVMPMKSVLFGIGGAMIVFNILIAMIFMNKNMKQKLFKLRIRHLN